MPTVFNPEIGAYVHTTYNALVQTPHWDVALTHPYNQSLMANVNQMKSEAGLPPIVVTTNAPQGKEAKKAMAMKNTKPLVPMEGITFGADPELFVKNDKGEFVCADMIPGTKDEPFKVKHGAVQRDGFAAEYNIDPCTTFDEWNRNHKAVQGQLQSMLPKGFTLVATPAVRFSPEAFGVAPDEAKELGCSPDWNAWDAALNPPPRLPDDPTLRCAGGHIHFGYTENAEADDPQHIMNGFDLTKQLDWFLGAWSLKHDKDVERRRLYGKAGACRIKPYGVEYRVLSNFWVMDKELRLEVWNRMVQAVASMRSHFYPEIAAAPYNSILQQSINDGKLDSNISRTYPCPVNSITQLLAA